MRIHGMGTEKFARKGVSHRSGHPYDGRRDGDRAPAAQLEAKVYPGLPIAQVSHGPGGMAEVHLAFLAILLVGGLAFLALRRRRSSDRDRGSDRRHEP
jgi:MYXO-CTERM domain-containing protein